MSRARHAVHRRGSTSRHRRRRPSRLLSVLLPVAGVGAAAGAAVAVTAMTPGGAPAAFSPVNPVPFDVDADVDDQRADAAAAPARGANGTPSPLAGAGTPSAPAAPAPATHAPAAPPVPVTPTPTGFPPVPGCTATVPGSDVDNGELGDEYLCDIGSGERLRPDAAAAFVALDAHYRAEGGASLAECLTDSYRSYAEQVDVADRKPGLAAEPGTSEHGWGLAVDIGCGANSFSGALYEWLDTNAGDFGWANPTWARPSGSTPEPWHWEFDPDSLP